MLPRDEAMERALLDDRDDGRRWAVYADWLDARGSPFGALASLMLEREAHPGPRLDAEIDARLRAVEELLPPALRTLPARGAGELTTVFRRGLPYAAGAMDDADFEALAHDPLFQFLDRAELRPRSLDTLVGWFESAPSLPWRHLTLVLADEADLTLAPVLARLPRLRSLRLETGEPCASLDLGRPKALVDVTLVPGSVPSVEAALALPALTRLAAKLDRGVAWDPPGADELEPIAATCGSRLQRLESVVLEGVPGVAASQLVTRGRVVRALAVDAAAEAPFTTWPGDRETAFVLIRGELRDEHQQHLITFARHAGVQRLVAHLVVLPTSAAPVSVLRLSGVGEAPLVPRVAAEQLARQFADLDAVGFMSSSSNNAVDARRFGAHVGVLEPVRGRRRVATKFLDGTWDRREPVLRQVLSSLVGVDPGPGVLERLLDELDLASPHVWLGPPLGRDETLPVFTELAALAEAAEDEDDDGRTDALEEPGEDDDSYVEEAWAAEELEEPQQFGSEPDPNVVFSWPAPDPPPDVRVLPGAHLEDDPPEDDLDPPGFDAADATPEEVWTQGPLELPEHHDATVGDPISAEDESAPLEGSHFALEACACCHQPAPLRACADCHADVCAACWEQPAAFEAEAVTLCRECAHRVTAVRHVAPRGSR
ncbi:MAG: hypothetical protein JNJ54_20435 [Myxococcaceae bacterium]|nr:hypothetical protein [Myxococcaceae bacterium]